MLRSLALAPLLALGCAAETESPAAEPRASVDIGVPAGDDELEFASLAPGGELRLQTFGQGGTHVLLGVQTTGFGSRAFVAVTLENLATGATVTAPAPVRPQLFICEDGVCDLVPLLVMTAGLTETGTERDGVAIEVQVDVHDDAGAEASATREAVLSTEDL
jgi:hypothetical protein